MGVTMHVDHAAHAITAGGRWTSSLNARRAVIRAQMVQNAHAGSLADGLLRPRRCRVEPKRQELSAHGDAMTGLLPRRHVVHFCVSDRQRHAVSG